MSHSEQPKPRCECHECTQSRSGWLVPLRNVPTTTSGSSLPLSDVPATVTVLRTQLAASEEKLRVAREALQRVCDALAATRAYSGVQYGKSALARAINDACAALKAIGEEK